jgi:hypothetical protein
MFKGVVKAEIIHFCNWKKIIILSFVFVTTLLVGQFDYMSSSYSAGQDTNGIVEILGNALMFDKFKIIMVILLNVVYTSSFCVEINSNFYRMILSRENKISYVQGKFLVNTVGIIIISMVCFYLAAASLSPFFSLVCSEKNYECYYFELGNYHPLIYIGLMGLQFGLLAAAFGAIGLLFSTFQSDSFVCIGITGLIFYLSASYIPENSIFDILPIVSLGPCFTKNFDSSYLPNLLWGMLYPIIIICVSAYLFEKRIKYKYENGYI